MLPIFGFSGPYRNLNIDAAFGFAFARIGGTLRSSSIMKRIPRSSRRQFLATGAVALGFPTIVPSRVFGQNAPSNRITMAVFGWGMMGPGNTNSFLQESDCQIVAACDIDKKHLEQAAAKINGHYKNSDCKLYHDYREVMARKDIDTVMLALPDNWHALTAI